MSEKSMRSNAYWSGRADEYSALHMKAFGTEKKDRFAKQVDSALQLVQTGRMPLRALDLGCGSGFMSLILLEQGCEVTGVDFSAEMLAHARDNVASFGYDATFLQMAAQSLELPDASFDLVVSRNVTWVLEDVDDVYAEVFRVLAPGGVFLNMDANYGRGFNEADNRGETPTHPTQTLEQLRERNEIARDLAITLADRPSWDIGQFWQLGASEVRCRRIGEGQNAGPTQMFALEVRK